MLLIWSEQFADLTSLSVTVGSPPNESPTQPWDTWDFRGLWNQPMISAVQQPPNNLLFQYPLPWQIYPR